MHPTRRLALKPIVVCLAPVMALLLRCNSEPAAPHGMEIGINGSSGAGQAGEASGDPGSIDGASETGGPIVSCTPKADPQPMGSGSDILPAGRCGGTEMCDLVVRAPCGCSGIQIPRLFYHCACDAGSWRCLPSSQDSGSCACDGGRQECPAAQAETSECAIQPWAMSPQFPTVQSCVRSCSAGGTTWQAACLGDQCICLRNGDATCFCSLSVGDDCGGCCPR